MGAEPLGSREIWEKGLLEKVLLRARSFINRIKEMIIRMAYIPDLAGVGKLLLTPRGEIKLVDINNISGVTFGFNIDLDDKGYPVCDKSVEALSFLEEKLFGKEIDRGEPLDRTYLDPR